MKYQINEKPNYSLVPIIELGPNEIGIIKYIGIYKNSSIIYLSEKNGETQVISCENDSLQREGFEKKLVNFKDGYLKRFANKFNLSFEELKELRKLEKEYRDGGKI